MENMNDADVTAGSYVLITAAHNEEAYIEKPLHAVVNQSVKPLQWIIVNDRSTDGTGELIKQYQARYEFIKLLTLTGDNSRNFGAQVHAINKGYELARQFDFEFIGNLDADISFGTYYFEKLLSVFSHNPTLGLAGGTVCEEVEGVFRPRKTNNPRSVPHAVQFFRRSCFDGIGGYKPLKYGGPDWYAEVMARMKGWDVQAVPELEVFHHRPTLGAEGMLRGCIRQGMMDYSLGSHPLFEIVKCARRMQERPLLGLTRLLSFFWATCTAPEREASDEFKEYLRKEQWGRLKNMLRR